MQRRNGLMQARVASITSVSVTIQSLKIDNKQVTQALFKQFPTERLITFSPGGFTFEGDIWGWVNYNPDSYWKGTQWVVQIDETLYRCPFDVRMSKELFEWVRHPRPPYDPHELQFLEQCCALMNSHPVLTAESWDGLMFELARVPQLYIAC